MSPERAKELARALEERVWNDGDTDALDELTTPGYIVHDLAEGEELRGREAVRKAIAPYRRAFADMELTVCDVVAEADRAVVRWEFAATHTGRLMGVSPTGRRVEVSGTDIFRIEGDRIAEAWVISGDVRWLRAAGALPGEDQDAPNGEGTSRSA
jgi:steroid delta-isomerase-like uncharacterized protein